jgi:RNA polymerase sigma-70 factor (ECF subfamily)
VTENAESQRLQEEAAWVAAALDGDPQGFEALMRRYQAPVGRMLRTILRNAEDTEDLLQETFLRAYRFLHRFDAARPFGPWIMRIGANLARNHLRHRRTRKEVALDDSPEDGEDERFEGGWLADRSSLEDLSYRQLLGETVRVLASLPENLRVVLEMRLLAEMSYKEISDALEIPVGTVMSRLSRGRDRIGAKLAEVAGVQSRRADSASPQATAPEAS